MYNFYKIGNKMICRLGEFLFVISILVLLGSLLFVMVYALFFNNEYEYFDFNNGLLYIVFWIVLLAIGVKIVDRSPNSFLKSDSKDDITKKEE
ncbi:MULTISPECIES: hypothetical protein [Aliarcobacter]|uniref:Membrane protein n=1 Tax=Aliarcobacter skirrowii CCUG 10374 TaxID=1032239 RepID=A0AAD0WNB2_9BACT|nr:MULTISPECIES: hypothetical protein [Aliarcobacter]AXX84596.1 putative membrane protein [Aliarcobacter skirrowii CCUG 10374]KAB0619894.1 hypothetical protein F7P70_09550 [Aliarcobacter skirrowii CCUG 10374]OCL85952.1 hypothetical protein AAX26_01601 [Aliarcobacter thereius]RXI24719.1 hypothetical protein CP959_09805 [Aliarcobacter skirrowii CCUG 10374]SUV14758.1 Uncharacterised protein [Aliarcobacter skirrowii]